MVPSDPTPATPPRFVVAVTASAGGLRALSELLAALPTDFPAAVVIVQHIDPRHRSMLAEILARKTTLSVKQAEEGDLLTCGVVYIAPPDRHLLVNPDATLSLSRSELVHFVRPSGDLLFESVAASFKTHAVAVILTGTGSDGSMGAQAIKRMGGKVIAQNQATAEFSGMPEAAVRAGVVDFELPLGDIAGVLEGIVR